MIDDKIPASETEFPDARLSIKAAMNAFRTGIERDLSICFPACVYEYNKVTHKATVMPLIKAGYFKGQYIYIRRQPFEVTVRSIQCGSIAIDYPLHIGDTGWVISSDRDTVLLKQEGTLTTSVLNEDRELKVIEEEYQAEPNQPRLHQLTQGFFIPDRWGEIDYDRYKDSLSFNPREGVYIGTGFDTKDDYQDGDYYEKHESSSFIVSPHQGVELSNSLKVKAGRKAGLSLSNAKVEISVENWKDEEEYELEQNGESKEDKDPDEIKKEEEKEDEKELKDEDKYLGDKNAARAIIGLSNDDGVVIRHVSAKGIAVIKLSNTCVYGTIDTFAGETDDESEEGIFSFCIKNGELQVNASHAVSVVAKEAKVLTTGNTDVTVAGDVSVNAGKNANIAVAESVNVAASKEVSVVSGEKVTIESGGTVDVKVAEDIMVQGGKSIQIKTEEGDISIEGSKGLNIKSETIEMTAKDITITGESTLNLSAPNYRNEV